MKMQIVSCPRCGTFLLNDTAECHGCGHVLDQQSASQLESRALPTDNAVQEDMEACPNCGETCRTGLVRCWNCSSFLRPDIEASYRKKQESVRQVIEHVDLQILEASSVTEEDSFNRGSLSSDAYHAPNQSSTDDIMGDEDFELSSDAQFSESDNERYDLIDNSEVSIQSGDSADSNDLETFQLQASLIETPVLDEDITDSELEPIGEINEPPVRAEASEPPIRSELAEPPVRSAKDRSAVKDDSIASDLLQIAADEEKDIQQVRKSQRSKDTFLIFCPQGCRIRVKEKHRGKSGKCPRCQCEFFVPRKPVAKKDEKSDEAKVEPVAASRFKKWLDEIRLHTVDPQKLRIKADSLLNEAQAVDLGFSADDLLVATLIAGKFGANVKKTPAVRTAMVEHFLKQGTIEALTIAAKKVYSKDLLTQFALVQPPVKGTESLFGDIPVFGTNRIAVRIPKTSDDTHPKYLSFCLSEFRAFIEGMQSVCGIEGFGTNVDLPLSDVYATFKCHLSQAPVLELAHLNYYEKDPGFKLEVSGWRCAACGIVISEAARAGAKLGGANSKGLAKAKCPKCSLKYGNLPLYQLVGAADPKPAAEADEAAMG